MKEAEGGGGHLGVRPTPNSGPQAICYWFSLVWGWRWTGVGSQGKRQWALDTERERKREREREHEGSCELSTWQFNPIWRRKNKQRDLLGWQRWSVIGMTLQSPTQGPHRRKEVKRKERGRWIDADMQKDILGAPPKSSKTWWRWLSFRANACSAGDTKTRLDQLQLCLDLQKF